MELPGKIEKSPLVATSSEVIWSGCGSERPTRVAPRCVMRFLAHSARTRPGAKLGRAPPGAVCWLPRMLNVITCTEVLPRRARALTLGREEIAVFATLAADH